jgi:hypothetical protein
MKRTDAHSPTNFVAGDYEFHDCLYQGPVTLDNFTEMDYWRALKARVREDVEKQDFKGNWYKHHTCDHCGTHFSYGAVYIHLKTGEFVVVGHQCADETFSPSFKRANELARMKAIVKHGLARNKRQAAVVLFCEKNPGLAAALELADKHHILQDLKFKLGQYSDLSEKQVALALKIAVQVNETDARRAAEALEPKVPVVVGKRDVAGTILATKVQEGDYGTTYKMLVKLDSGEKVWGSIPSDIIGNDGIQVLRGKEVSFTATFEVGDDPCFGFFKRPRKASLKQQEVTCAQ